MKINFTLNGKLIERDVNPQKILLDFLRKDMGLTSVKKGCEVGECGACTVLINKKAVNSCMTLLGQVDGCEVITLEGIDKKLLEKIQYSFLKGGAVQCGFCTPGMIMSVIGLLYENPTPNEDEIKRAIDGNLCRCTGYKQIIESVENLHLGDIDIREYI